MPDDRYLEPEIETMSRADLDAFQEERILELVPYAYERSALVRKTWEEAGVKPSDINSMDDYRERAPSSPRTTFGASATSTTTHSAAPSCVDYADGTTFFSTSGTTGDATFYGHGWTQWHPFWAATARNLWDVGVRPGDRVLGLGIQDARPAVSRRADDRCDPRSWSVQGSGRGPTRSMRFARTRRRTRHSRVSRSSNSNISAAITT